MQFIHELSDVQNRRIGQNTKVEQYAVILPGAEIGKECHICAHTLIENDVTIGNGVTIRPGVQISKGIDLADNVFIGPNVTFANDPFSGNRPFPGTSLRTTVGKGATVGAGAIILFGIEIGERAQINAGAVVTRSVPPYAIVEGNPAHIMGYVDASDDVDESPPYPRLAELPVGVTQTRVAGVTLHRFPFVSDMRGDLTIGEFEKTVPFVPKRYFLVLNVPSLETRGEHAHRECQQFLICVHGSCALVADDGTNRQEFLLDRADIGLYLPPMIWGIQYKYSDDAVLLVFASHYYDTVDYIRDYSIFRQHLGQ